MHPNGHYQLSSGGYGRESGAQHLESFRDTKSVTLKPASERPTTRGRKKIMSKSTLFRVLLSCAMAAAGAAYAQAGYDKPIKISIAVSNSHPMATGVNRFAEIIEAKSGGQMKAKVYPGGSLGNDVQVISSLQGGTVEATLVTVGLLSGMVKEYSLLTLPGVFHTTREADQVLDGPFGQKLSSKLADHRLVGLSYMEHGFKNIMNNKRPITKWEDASGLKIRVTQTPSLVDLFSAIGANPVPMAFGELYGALEQGAVDGMENSLVTFESGKFSEVQKYIGMTQHVYDPLILLLSRSVWDRMSPAQRRIVSEAAVEASKVQRQATRESEAKLISALRAKGLVISELSPSELSRLRARMAPIADKYKALASEETVKELNAELAKARAVAGR